MPAKDFLTIAVFLIVGIAFVVITLLASLVFRPYRPSDEKNLTYECGEDPIGPAWLQFRVGYYIYALIFLIFDVEAVFVYPWASQMLGMRRHNLAVLGLVSTLISGGLGLMKMSGFWFAVKEAALPLVLGLAIPLSQRTSQPLVRTLLYNDQVLDTRLIHEALLLHNRVTDFDALLAWASWMLAGAMLVGGAVNFGLAVWLLPAQSGTPEFVRQLGKLQLWSWPGTMIPTSGMIFYALFRLLKGVEALTGLSGNDLFHRRP